LSESSQVEQPLVYVVVLNYRNYADTIRCVRSLEGLHYDNFRIVVVDNGSPNESERELRAACAEHIVVQSGSNLGYAGGNNVGIQLAMDQGADYIAILNNDTLASDPDLLKGLVDYAERDPSAGLMTPLVVDPKEEIDPCCTRRSPSLMELFWNRGIGRWIWPIPKWEERLFYQGEVDYREPAEVEVISGASMFVRRELIEEIGLLDDRTFLFWEEFILFEKIRKTAFRTMLVPDPRITHIRSQSLKGTHLGPVLANLKSLDLYLKRYRAVPLPIRWSIIVSGFLYWLPGLVKTLTGARALEARVRGAD
jgi:GT2 family glycosyltransferase